MSDDPRRIDLSLISHTNVGKTTLARTLLGQDVGEVRDAAHVTGLAEPYTMIETPQGDSLRLWDTPGFGDSARLAKRLAQSGNPIGWFLSEFWDRWRDRPFWSSQQAVRNVREQADVVLYLVNAAEDPSDAGYVAPEMQILAWIGKPAVVLLNQVGEPRPHEIEAAEETRWRNALAPHAIVRAVLTLDAFARCWVQEMTLLAAVGDVLPEAKRASFARLASAWRGRRLDQFDASMRALAEQVARAACDREPLPGGRMRDALRDVGRAMGLGEDAEASVKERAMGVLSQRLDADIRATMDRLISIHGLEGRAAAAVLERVRGDYDVRERVNEGKAAILGGVVSGALTGLKADLAAGGLTFGAGMLVGGVLGALGAAGLARGFNVVRGTENADIRWSDEALDALLGASLLRYLAVAHYGRGRGEWVESEYPPFWKDAVARVLAAQRAAVADLWSRRAEACAGSGMPTALHALLDAAAGDLLHDLYPEATVERAG